MNFVTIDFETANRYRNSACELGLTFVEDNQVVETKSWLIRPPKMWFEPMNISIHGIDQKDVWDKMTFKELWQSEVKELITGKFLIAHNATFDFSVLRKTLDTYRIPFPELHYSCSYLFARRIWQNMPRYDLKTLCNSQGIQFRHHRAGSDSDATAQLSLKAFEEASVSSKESFSKKLQINIGRLYKGGYIPSTYVKKKKTKYA